MEKFLVSSFSVYEMMLPDVICHENQSQKCSDHRCLCLVLSGRITTPDGFSYHTGSEKHAISVVHRGPHDDSSRAGCRGPDVVYHWLRARCKKKMVASFKPYNWLMKITFPRCASVSSRVTLIEYTHSY